MAHWLPTQPSSPEERSWNVRPLSGRGPRLWKRALEGSNPRLWKRALEWSRLRKRAATRSPSPRTSRVGPARVRAVPGAGLVAPAATASATVTAVRRVVTRESKKLNIRRLTNSCIRSPLEAKVPVRIGYPYSWRAHPDLWDWHLG